MTQQQRLLQAFQEKQDLMVYEIMAPRPNGLGIAQYNARIKELREQGHPIENVSPGHFRYQVKEEIKTMTDKPEPYSYGYQKFKQVGNRIKNTRPSSVYQDLSTKELEDKKQTAEAWLKENKDHAKYADALKRYEAICDEIMYREAKEVFHG